MAEFYSAELSQKINRGLRESAYKHNSIGGQIPLGYKTEGKKLVIDEETAPIVRQAFEMYAEGHSVAEICRTFNARGYKTSKGTRFGKSSFSKIFRNEKYIGVYGGLNFNGVIMKNESDDQESPPTYTMRLYGPYSGERTLSVFANLRGFQPEDYKAFLDNEQFANVMNSLVIDPNGYHEPGTASENGFTTDRGQIASYTGSDTALEIPARIGQFDTESIGFRVFAGNTAITSVVIPEGVTVIQPNAFEGCSNLECVTFPDTLMEIDANAFRNCPKLKDVTLPRAVAFVGAHAFDSSGAGTFTGAGAEYGACCFVNMGHLDVNLPEGLEAIPESCFGSTTLDVLVIPESVTSIGDYATYGAACIVIQNPNVEKLPVLRRHL